METHLGGTWSVGIPVGDPVRKNLADEADALDDELLECDGVLARLARPSGVSDIL